MFVNKDPHKTKQRTDTDTHIKNCRIEMAPLDGSKLILMAPLDGSDRLKGVNVKLMFFY